MYLRINHECISPCFFNIQTILNDLQPISYIKKLNIDEMSKFFLEHSLNHYTTNEVMGIYQHHSPAETLHYIGIDKNEKKAGIH
jgi:hypothetical protein